MKAYLWTAFALVLWIGAGSVAVAQTLRIDEANVGRSLLIYEWQPLVTLAGAGDTDKAVAQIEDYLFLQRRIVADTRYHEQTRQFIDDVWDSFTDFDLDDLHELLPIETDEGREIRLYGNLVDNAYYIGPEPRGRAVEDFSDLGNLDALISSERIKDGRKTHYLLKGELSVGIGEVYWPTTVRAGAEFLDRVSHPPQVFASDTTTDKPFYSRKVLATNPALDVEETQVLTGLWASYPAIAELLAGLGRIDSLLATDKGGDGVHHLDVRMSLDPAKVERNYPALADFFRGVGRLLFADVKLVNEDGEIARMSLDTDRLEVTLSMAVRDGFPLVKVAGQPLSEARALKPEDAHQFTAIVDSELHILGVRANVDQLLAEFNYTPGNDGSVLMTVTEVPEVEVGGLALGFVPTGLISVVLPQSLEELITDFMSVMVKGNDKQGIVLRLGIDPAQREGDASVLDLKVAFEALDNFFVSIGMSIINDRFVPDNREIEEIKQLIGDVHSAMADDLDRYQRISGQTDQD